MPVLLHVVVGNAVLRPALLVGPYVAWKVLEKVHLNGSGDSDFEGENDAARAIDLGYAGGLALEMGPSLRCVTLEARYSSSLQNIQKPEYDGDVHNCELRITLGWKQVWQSPGGL
jgi:hypothetical protein